MIAAALAFFLPIIESRFIIFRVLYSVFPCFPVLNRLGTAERLDSDSDTPARKDSQDSLDSEDAKLKAQAAHQLENARSTQPLTQDLVPPFKVSPSDA